MKTRDRPSTLTGGQAAPSGTPRRTRGRGPRQERAVTWLFLLPALIYIALFFGYPIVKNAIMGSQDYTTATFYTGSAPWVGWANYSRFLSSLAGWHDLPEHRRVHRGFHRGSVHDRHGHRAVLPSPVPVERAAALAAAAAVAAPAHRGRGSVAVDPGPGQRRAQQHAAAPASGSYAGAVVEQPGHGPVFGDHRQRLDRDPLQRHALVQRHAGHPGGTLRSRAQSTALPAGRRSATSPGPPCAR